jgi:hypothetical protein
MTFVGVTDDGSLQFAESEAKEVKLTPFNWSRSCQLSDKYFARYKNGNGVSSLAEMALRSVVKYRHALTADVLEDVPWDPLGEKVCEKIKDMYVTRGLNIDLTSIDILSGEDSQCLSGRSLWEPTHQKKKPDRN